MGRYNIFDALWDSFKIGIIIGVIIQIIFIVITIKTAKDKGYSGGLAFLLCLFMPAISSLIIIALLPDNTIRYNSNDTVYKSLNIDTATSIFKDTAGGNDNWICPQCHQKNPNTSSFCKGCGEYK
jgi:ABC-type uncharacterized transport system permease subunit